MESLTKDIIRDITVYIYEDYKYNYLLTFRQSHSVLVPIYNTDIHVMNQDIGYELVRNLAVKYVAEKRNINEDQAYRLLGTANITNIYKVVVSWVKLWLKLLFDEQPYTDYYEYLYKATIAVRFINKTTKIKLLNSIHEDDKAILLKIFKTHNIFKTNAGIPLDNVDSNVELLREKRLYDENVKEPVKEPVKEIPNPNELKHIAKQDTIKDKVKKLAINDDDLKTLEEFVNYTSSWEFKRKGVREWYEDYVKWYSEKHDRKVNYTDFEKVNPYKTKGLLNRPKEVSNYFNLKRNKKYMLHHVAKHGTYQIDLMFDDDIAYLIAIEVNTRYLAAEMTNIEVTDNILPDHKKTAYNIRNALVKMLGYCEIKYVIGDGERGFVKLDKSGEFERLGIKYLPIQRIKTNVLPKFMKNKNKKMNNKTDPYHTSTALVDRVIRTIRDMAYNLKVGRITPDVMKFIVNVYNNSVHNNLSKYAGFKVTPSMVHKDRLLEKYIMERIMAKNYSVRNSVGFLLPKGSKVKVYNDPDKMGKRRSVIRPGDYEVVSFKNGKYWIKEGAKNIMVPRYKIDVL